MIIASGSIANGRVYEVQGSSITYNGSVVNAGSKFKGTTITTYTGTGQVYEASVIKSSNISILYEDSSLKSVSISLRNNSIYWGGRVMKRFYTSHVAPAQLTYNITPIMIGQSNMTGAGGSGSDSVTPVPYTGALEYNSTSAALVQMTKVTGDIRGSFSGGYGLQPAFSNRYKTATTKDIQLIKHSVPGSTSVQWVNTYADESIGYINASIGLFTGTKILVYFQGEAEAGSFNTSEVPVEGMYNYKQNLITIFSKYRTAFGSNLKIFMIKPGYLTNVSDIGTDRVAQVFQEIIESVPYVYLGYDARQLNGPTYKASGDQIHFNQTALNLIGEGLADAVYNVLSKI